MSEKAATEPTIPTAHGINDVFAEWDDRAQTFRVYLARDKVLTEAEEDAGMENETFDPLRSALMENNLDSRLYQAAFLANPKDFTGSARDRFAHFEKQAQAERAARAVKAELKRIEKGEPAASKEALHMAAQIALILKKK